MNKAKIIRNAEKHVMQGRLHSAISEYKKIVEEDPKDLPVLNTIGDLYVRLGRTDEGLKFFNQLANAYLEGGFKVKAIAIYKKITKLDPGGIEARRHLAELYALQGLMSDARAQYLQLVDAYLGASQENLAAEALRKLLSGDPNNTTILTRLVEVEIRRGNHESALKLLLAATERLLKSGRLGEAREMLSRGEEIDPDNFSLKAVLAKVKFAEGQHDEAIAMLQKMDPQRASTEVQISLWECLLGADQLEEAGVVAQHLFAIDSVHYPLLFTLSDRHLASFKFEQVVQNLDPLIESPMIDTFGVQILETLQKVLSEQPDYLPAIERAVKVNRTLGQSHLLSLSLEQLASCHLKRGNLSPAMTAYQELLDIDPTNTIVRQAITRLQSQMESHGETESIPVTEEVAEEVSEEAPQEFLGDQVEISEELETEESMLSEPSPVIPEKETPEEIGGEPVSVAEIPAEPVPPPEPPAVTTLTSEETNEFVNGLILEGELLMGYGLFKRAGQLFQELLRVSPNHPVALRQLVDIYSSMGQLNEAADCCMKLSEAAVKGGQREEARLWAERAGEFTVVPVSEAVEGEPALQAVSETVEIEELPVAIEEEKVYDLSSELEEMVLPAEAPEPPKGEPVAETPEAGITKGEEALQETVEEIDFYMEQGLWNEARTLVEKGLKSYPESQLLLARLERCDSAPKGVAEESESMPEIVEEWPEAAHPAPPPPPAPVSEVPPEPVVEPGPPAEVSPISESIAQAPVPAEVAPISEPIAQAPVSAEASQSQGLGDIFAEFNIIGSTIDASGDFNTHYNLGIAFREMGLLEEAIAEVQKAISILNPHEQKQEYLSVCSLLGLCLVESKNYPEAIEWMVRGLLVLGDAEKNDEYLSLEYDLANAYQLAGNTDRAREIFQKIQSENPRFRDIEKRLQSLHQPKFSN